MVLLFAVCYLDKQEQGKADCPSLPRKAPALKPHQRFVATKEEENKRNGFDFDIDFRNSTPSWPPETTRHKRLSQHQERCLL